MGDAEPPTANALSPVGKSLNGKKTNASVKKSFVKPAHPKTAVMVNAAIRNLKEQGGSSLYAIKKYITYNYKVDAEKMAPFIKKYLKSGVTSGSLVQTKGKGASGSFKLADCAPTEKSATKTSKPKSAKPNNSNPIVEEPKSSPEPEEVKPAAEKPTEPKEALTKKQSATSKNPKAKSKLKPKSAFPKTKAPGKTPTKKPKASKSTKTTAEAKTSKQAA